MGRSGLPAHLIPTLFVILSAANLNYGSLQSLEQDQGSDPKDKGGDGVIQQGHHGKGLQESKVQDQGCYYC